MGVVGMVAKEFAGENFRWHGIGKWNWEIQEFVE